MVPMNYTLHMGTSKIEAEEEEFVVFFRRTSISLHELLLICQELTLELYVTHHNQLYNEANNAEKKTK